MKKTTWHLSRGNREYSPFWGSGDFGQILLSQKAMSIAKKSFCQFISTKAFLHIKPTLKHVVFSQFMGYFPSCLDKLKLADMGSNMPFSPIHHTKCRIHISN